MASCEQIWNRCVKKKKKKEEVQSLVKVEQKVCETSTADRIKLVRARPRIS